MRESERKKKKKKEEEKEIRPATLSTPLLLLLLLPPFPTCIRTQAHHSAFAANHDPKRDATGTGREGMR